MDLSQFELDDSELSEVTNWGVSNPASALPALYHLFLYGVRSDDQCRVKDDSFVS